MLTAGSAVLMETAMGASPCPRAASIAVAASAAEATYISIRKRMLAVDAALRLHVSSSPLAPAA